MERAFVYRVLHVGLGPLGLMVARDLHARGMGVVVAAVDSDPGLAGRRLGELVAGAGAGVRVMPGLDDGVLGTACDCAVVTTVSDLGRAAGVFRALLERGISVVSTCEELVYPWLRHAGLAEELDGLARRRGARILGTGVNPGFVMDALPVFASGVCRRVERVGVWRVQDAATRRGSFQKKIGAGLSGEEFERRVREGTLRHVGLGESVHFISRHLGLGIDWWGETIEPVRAERAMSCAAGEIAAGGVAGVRQVAEGRRGGEVVVRLEFQAAIGQAEPHDRVLIEGGPRVDLVIGGGVHGDVATSAITLNAIPALLGAPAGLHTMGTVRMVGCWGGGRQ